MIHFRLSISPFLKFFQSFTLLWLCIEKYCILTLNNLVWLYLLNAFLECFYTSFSAKLWKLGEGINVPIRWQRPFKDQLPKFDCLSLNEEVFKLPQFKLQQSVAIAMEFRSINCQIRRYFGCRRQSFSCCHHAKKCIEL